jgi:antitoxin component YwqK of YwqJK toxin-antitoxin module
MKKLLLFAGLVMLILACSPERVNFSQLQDRNGLYYLVNNDKPFSGQVVSMTNGKTEFEGSVENGLKTGRWTYYYPNGQKKQEGIYSEGLKDGNWTSWKENGQSDYVEVYKFGKNLKNDARPDSATLQQPPPPSVVDNQVTAGTLQQTEPAKPSKIAQPDQKAKTEKASGAQPEKKMEKKEEALLWQRLHGGPVKYLNGVPYTGAVIKYWPNGNKEFEGYLHSGRKSGKWTNYDRYGNIKNIKYY